MDRLGLKNSNPTFSSVYMPILSISYRSLFPISSRRKYGKSDSLFTKTTWIYIRRSRPHTNGIPRIFEINRSLEYLNISSLLTTLCWTWCNTSPYITYYSICRGTQHNGGLWKGTKAKSIEITNSMLSDLFRIVRIYWKICIKSKNSSSNSHAKCKVASLAN